MPRSSGKSGTRLLIRGGAVMSMDPQVGDFSQADVLVDGARIIAIERNLQADEAQVIDASGKIVMPGFIDTHHHLHETTLRGYLADAVLMPDGTSAGAINYGETMAKVVPAYREEDIYISELFGLLSQVDCGVTAVHDLSGVHNSPAQSAAAIQALKDSRGRAVLCYLPGGLPGNDFPQEVARLRREQFASNDQLVTLSLGGEIYFPNHERLWRTGRELDVQIASHVVGPLGLAPVFDQLAQSNQFGPDNLFIHMTGISELGWRKVADAGAHVSLAVPIEMLMRHGMPPIQTALGHGLTPSLSSDVECALTADFFTQMRACMGLQRALLNEKVMDGTPAADIPALLTARDVLRFATINGAKALRLDGKTGSLTPGKEADIIILDATAINVAPLNYVPGAVVGLMERSNVETVMVAGSIRKWKGRLLDFDVNTLRARIEQSRDHLFAAAGIRCELFRPD